MDTIGGIIFAAGTCALISFNPPWYMLIIPVISTLGWFGMAIYCFRFAAKCKCKELRR